MLEAATARGGRPRMFADNLERARTAVRKALLRALAAIAVTEPELAEHLRVSVTTGTMCRYDPHPDWTISATG
jgi:hypothetical protein